MNATHQTTWTLALLIALGSVSCSDDQAPDPNDFSQPSIQGNDVAGRGTAADGLPVWQGPAETTGTPPDAGAPDAEVAATSVQRACGRSLDDRFDAVCATADGGFAAAGETLGPDGANADAWVMRSDGCGHPLWAQAYGGPGEDRALSVAALSDGGLVFAGETFSAGAAGDAWVVRLDGQGQVIWSYALGGAGPDVAAQVVQDPQGRIVLAGSTKSIGPGALKHHNLLVAAMDVSGKLLWGFGYGGKHDSDTAFALAALKDASGKSGGFLVAGGSETWGQGQDDVWLLRLDAQGKVHWSAAYGTQDDEEARAVVAAKDGGFLVTGYAKGAQGDDVFALKVDGGGKQQWMRRYGTAGHERAYAVALIPQGYLLAGRTDGLGSSDDGLLIRVGFKGQLLDFQALGGHKSDALAALAPAAGGSVVAVGRTRSDGAGGYDAWWLRTDPVLEKSCDLKPMDAKMLTQSAIEAVRTVSPLEGGAGLVRTLAPAKRLLLDASTLCGEPVCGQPGPCP